MSDLCTILESRKILNGLYGFFGIFFYMEVISDIGHIYLYKKEVWT